MTELPTSAEMRAIEAAAIASGEVTGSGLMERAGAEVVAAILEWRPDLASAPAPGASTGAAAALVLCGPGNNGGDGFVVARLLRDRGWRVDVHFWGDADRLPPDARVLHDRWAAEGPVRPFRDLRSPGPEVLVIDALFGGGLARDVPAEIPRHLDAEEFFALPKDAVVAIDAPLGLCLDSGRLRGMDGARTRGAGLTVTFQWPRAGHYLGEGPDVCGRLVVRDIGLGRPPPGGAADAVLSRAARLLTRTTARHGAGIRGSTFAKHARHKYQAGHVLVLAGGVGRGGAARLAARAALRVGAGLVTLGCPPAALQENAARLDAVMLRPLADAEALAALLTDPRINSVCIGPGFGSGFGTNARARDMLAAAIAATPSRDARADRTHARFLVLDADALTILARAPDLMARLHDACVLTPHGGEFARLFPDLAARLADTPPDGPAFSKLDAAREAAARSGAIVLLKGPDTVIAAPCGSTYVSAASYDRAVPWLATAGAGDVLAGMIAGRLAMGDPTLEAVCAAAWLHVEAARAFGPGLIAEDLPEMLPQVFRDLGV